MERTTPISREFYSQPTLQVARQLLGKILVRIEDNGERTSGMIIETEAYIGETDLACHARVGLTPRTSVMYGEPGLAYVYFTYGLHWLLNFVTESAGFPAAVLIRSVQPVEGISRIAARRKGIATTHWTDGPAKLTRAFAIGKPFNGYDTCIENPALFVEDAEPIQDYAVTKTPRVGLNSVPEPWKSKPWRFLVTGI